MWYLVIGFIFTFLFRMDDDTLVITHPSMAVLVILGWPLIIIWAAFHAKKDSFQFKNLWRK